MTKEGRVTVSDLIPRREIRTELVSSAGIYVGPDRESGLVEVGPEEAPHISVEVPAETDAPRELELRGEAAGSQQGHPKVFQHTHTI